MEDKKVWEAVRYAASLPQSAQPRQTGMQRTTRSELDRQLGRHLIDAHRKEQSRRGIK